MKWKNNYPDNHCFFITSTVNGKLPILCDKSIYGLLLNNLEKCRSLFNFKILGYVIMPEHWHLLLYFRSGSDCLSFVRDFKRFTSEEIVKILLSRNEKSILGYFSAKSIRKVKYTVWKEQARVIPISDIDKIKSKLDYIHNNPVKRGLVSFPDEHKLSSANYYLRGIQPLIKIDNLDLNNDVSGIVVPETQHSTIEQC